jgi:hypothetical protein
MCTFILVLDHLYWLPNPSTNGCLGTQLPARNAGCTGDLLPNLSVLSFLSLKPITVSSN